MPKLVSVILAAVLALHPGRAAADCTIAGQRWASVQDLTFNAVQLLDGRIGDNYEWSFNPCQPAALCPSQSPASAGFIQQQSYDGRCHTYWDTIVNAQQTADTTVLTLAGKGEGWDTTATVTITCDTAAGARLVDDNAGRVVVTTVSPVNFKFEFRFRSACACGHGCGGACKLGPVAWTGVPEMRFSGELVLAGVPQGQYFFAADLCAPPAMCPTAGLLQMATTARECAAHWDTVTYAGAGGGLLLHLAGAADAFPATAVVTVRCDPAAGPLLLDLNNGTVRATPAGLGNYTFDFEFRSGCACGKGCTSASCFVGDAAWYNVPELAFSAALVVDGIHQPVQSWGFQPCGAVTLCGAQRPGYLQSGDADCLDWGRPTAISSVPGVSVTVNLTATGASAVVTLLCDAQAPALLDANNGQIAVTTVAPGQRVALLKFRSRCACGNGCAPQ